MEASKLGIKVGKGDFIYIYKKHTLGAAFSSMMKRRRKMEIQDACKTTASETMLTCFYVQLLVVCWLKGG